MSLQVLYQPEPADRPLALALGGFDGVHIGHMRVLACALEGKKDGLCPAVFTFDHLIGTVKKTCRLTSALQQRDLLAGLGFERMYLADFDALRNLSPEQFVRDILHGQLHTQRVFCGFNYRFGSRGAGNSDLLRQLCAPFGIDVTVEAPVLADGAPISSTRIRALVAQGEMEQTARLLGRPFSIDFAVVHGRALGRTIGLPTINQPFPADFVLPRFGVYASAVTVDGRRYHGVTNVGVKPTVGADGPLAETCIAGYSGNLYGQCVPVELLKFLRPEQKFPSVEELRRQIIRDSAEAERILDANTALKT